MYEYINQTCSKCGHGKLVVLGQFISPPDCPPWRRDEYLLQCPACGEGINIAPSQMPERKLSIFNVDLLGQTENEEDDDEL